MNSVNYNNKIIRIFISKRFINLFALIVLTLVFLLGQKTVQAQCDFSVSSEVACGGTAITFITENNEPGYTWDFNNDGNYDTSGNVIIYTFPENTNDVDHVVTLYLDSVACSTDTLLILAVPDAAINVIPGTGTMEGNEIRVCSGAAEATLSIFNTSTTFDNNQSYTINWGDGIIENYDNSSFPTTGIITHDYSGFGYYNLQLTVTGVNGCVIIEDYVFYNGSNPSVGLANPGNTVGLCIPATITFPITNTENNPTGTVYSVFISGELVAAYSQDDIPSEFTYTFTETSCGMSTSTGNYQNAFDVQIIAENPCASSQATIEPIELSAPPQPSMDISEPFPCLESSTYILNTSESFEVENGNCSTNLAASWEITPGESEVDWNILDGNIFNSNELEIEFLLEGDYTISMTIHSEDCGDTTIFETITVVTPPEVGVEFEMETNANTSENSCIPTVVSFANLSQGTDLTWYWYISPIDGYEFIDSTSFLSSDAIIQFNEPDDYEITLFVTNACETITWDTIITVSDVPEIHLDPVGDYCAEATLNFSGSDIYFVENGSEVTDYFWHFPGATPDTSSDKRPQNIYYDTPGEYIITVEASNACGTTLLTDTFNILEPGALDLSPDTTLCIDAPGFLLSANPEGGVWSGNGVDPEGWFDPDEGDIGNNELFYEYDEGVCPVSGIVNVTIEELPQVDAGPNQSVCENDQPFFISGGSPENGIWSSDNGGVILSNSVFDPQASGPGVYNLTYIYSDINNCENFDEKIIIVHELPDVEAGEDISLCDNPYDVQLNGQIPAGGTWSGTGVSPEGVFNISNTPGIGDYELIYTYADPNTGCINTDHITITIFENPMAEAGADQILCINNEILELNSGSPVGGSWTGTGVNTAAGIFDPSIAGIGYHVLTYTFGESICETTDEMVVQVQELPLINLPEEQTFCEDAPLISLEDVNPSGGTWTGNGVQNNAFDPQLAGVGTHILTYNYTNPMTGCSNEESMEMIVYDIPEIVLSDTTYCNTPGTVELPLAYPPNGSWSGPGIINGTFDPQLAGGEGAYQINYVYTNPAGCSSFANMEVTVIPPPVLEAGPNDTLCIDQGIIQLEDFSPSGAIWSGAGIIDSINGIFDPELAGGGTHILTFSTGFGNCQVSDTRLMEVVDLTDAALGEGVEMCISDEPINIFVNGPSGGYWSGNGIVDQNSGLFDPAVSGPGVHTLTYTYINAAIGCNAFIVKDITVYDMLAPQMELPDLGCINETLQLINNSPADYSVVWNFGDGTTSVDFEPIHIYENLGTYAITLIGENSFGCIDSTAQDIQITETPTPFFQLDSFEGCAPLEINFTNQSTGFDVEFYWNFSNGISSIEPNPGPVIFNQGINDTTYYISLSAVNACGSSSHIDSVLVHPQPVANFGISPGSNCTPVVAEFANVTTGSATSFFWDFGNGNTSTDSIPIPQTYYTDTTTIYYTVSLTATNDCGSSTTTQQVAVDPADVQSFFNASVTEGCQPLVVDFSDYSTPGANVDWIFGDGNSSIEQDPTHTFTEPGTYTVIQYASSFCGYDSTTLDIIVHPTPEVSFSNPPSVCLGQEVTFLNNSIGTTGHYWDFGDGDSSTLNNPIHIFNSPGLYTITLTGISAFNQCPNTFQSEILVLDAPSASFELSAMEGCVPLSIDMINQSIGANFFEWNFGDGNSSILENPSHMYFEAGSYPISLIVTDQNGCFNDTVSSNIIVHPSPNIDFEYERANLCGLPADVQFLNNTQGASGFLWDFDDGNQSFLNSPNHTYFQDGEYDINLIVSTPFGCIDSMQQEISIYPQPIADFTIDGMNGCSPLEVFFNNESDQANSYFWDFGNGVTSTEVSPFYIFEEAGNYDIQLIVANDDACFDTLIFEDAVEVLQDPFAGFEVIENQNGSFQFINHSEYADQYFWDFSDGMTSEEMNPNHRFLSNGVKQIYLEASSDNGCVDDTLISIVPGFIKALYIPNGFSPEQGIGDVRLFKPKGVGLKEYHIQVFSTYGQLIWESREIKEGQPLESWDGKLGGVLLPQDVYVWKASAIFEDGSAWRGVEDENGGFKTMGSLILLR